MVISAFSMVLALVSVHVTVFDVSSSFVAICSSTLRPSA